MAFYCLRNDSRRFIACVDAKCGSTTVRDWFVHTFEGPPDWSLVEKNMVPAATIGDYEDYRRIFFIRDPLRRLVSFYTQFVVVDPREWCFADDGGEVGLHDRTFAEFLQILALLTRADVRLQHHLQPQTRVLGRMPLDDVVPLRELDERMVAINRELGVAYTPRRLNARAYGRESYPRAYALRPHELRDHGPVTPESFFDDELAALSRSIYAADVEFYETHADLERPQA